MIKAYPRHSVDLSCEDYCAIFSALFASKKKQDETISSFEILFARYIDTRYAVTMPSARLGLYFLLKYFDFPQGSEVLITPFTHWSVFSVIKACRLNPVCVDIDEKTFNIDHDQVEKYINKKTRLLILTHMWGQPCAFDRFLEIKRKYGIKIIEDCAMACGAVYQDKKAGGFGDASIFSFGKAKAISAFGGGMLCTNDVLIFDYVKKNSEDFICESLPLLLAKAASSALANFLTRPEVFFLTIYPVLRFLNIRDPYNPLEHRKDAAVTIREIPPEWKVRMSAVQAAVGIEQLKQLDRRNEKRAAHAARLNKFLDDFDGVAVPLSLPQAKHTYLYYVLHIKNGIDLDSLRRKLVLYRVDTQLHELTTPQQLRLLGVDSAPLPVFEKVSNELLVIPNGINLTDPDLLYIADSLKNAIRSILSGA